MRVRSAFLVGVVLFPIWSLAQSLVPVHTSDDIVEKLHSLGGAPGTLLLDPGIHKVSETLYLSSGQSIRGQYGESILRWTGPAGGGQAVIAVFGTRGDIVGHLDPNTGHDVSINATAVGPVEISTFADGAPRSEDDQIIETGAGFRLLRRPFLLYPNGADIVSIQPADSIKLQDVHIDATGATYGVSLNLATNFRMEDSILDGSEIGVFASESYRTTIRRSEFRGVTYSAMRFEASTVAVIERNTIINSGVAGIVAVAGSSVFNIIENEVVGTGVTRPDGEIPGGDGMTFDHASFLTVTGNHILGANCYGISVGDFTSNSMIVNNAILGGITVGIVANNSDAGVDTASKSVIANNLIANNNGGSIALLPGRAMVVMANILDVNRGGGISGMDWPEVSYLLNIPTGQ